MAELEKPNLNALLYHIFQPMTHIRPESFSEATQSLISVAPSDFNTELYQGKLIDRIQLLEAEIVALKYRHNSVSVTCHLPPEILSNIFLAVLDVTGRITDHPEALHGENTRELMSWVYVSHVCQRWRTVALNCSELWTEIYIWKPSYIEAVLSRCRKAPLSVKYANFNKYENPLKAVLPKIEQLRVVHIGQPSSSFPASLPGFDALVKWTGGAPILEALYLTKTAPTSEYLPADFLQGGTPSLRDLVIDNCRVSWPGALMSGRLTKLVLRDDAFLSRRPLATVFLNSLGKLQRLETLELRGFVPEDVLPSDQSSHLPCLLPALRHLQIADLPQHIPRFFPLVRLPESTTRITLVIEHDDLTGGLDNIIGHSLRNVRRSFDNDNRICAGAYSAEFSRDPANPTFKFFFDADGSSSVHNDLCLTFHLNKCDLPIPTYLSIFDTHLNVSTITSLDMAMDLFPNSLSTGTWATISQLSKLNALVISGCHDALEYFIPQWEERLQSSTVDPCFPSLSNLTFSGIDIVDRDDRGKPRTLTHRLATVLRTQAATGNPLSELHIQGCRDFWEADYFFLKKSLPEIGIEWDRQEEPSDSDKFNTNTGWESEE